MKWRLPAQWVIGLIGGVSTLVGGGGCLGGLYVLFLVFHRGFLTGPRWIADAAFLGLTASCAAFAGVGIGLLTRREWARRTWAVVESAVLLAAVVLDASVRHLGGRALPLPAILFAVLSILVGMWVLRLPEIRSRFK